MPSINKHMQEGCHIYYIGYQGDQQTFNVMMVIQSSHNQRELSHLKNTALVPSHLAARKNRPGFHPNLVIIGKYLLSMIHYTEVFTCHNNNMQFSNFFKVIEELTDIALEVIINFTHYCKFQCCCDKPEM